MKFRSYQQQFMLTIAIPTYNRNQTLNKNLRLLLPQISGQLQACKVLFLDNCSPVPIAETLPEVLNDFAAVSYEIVRNKVNIGANANIMRCFELCETEWIWCLSDDDPLRPNALAIVFQHLTDHPDCVYFNFPYDDRRPAAYCTTGVEDFINKLDISANLPWISTSVHRTKNIQNQLKYGYLFSYSMLPHVAALFASLNSQERCYMATVRLMAEQTEETPPEQNWSIVSFALGAPIIYDLPLSFPMRQALMRKLLVTQHGESIDLKMIVTQLLLSYFKGDKRTERYDKKNLLYNYDQITYRNYYLSPKSKRSWLISYYRLILRFPHLSHRILNFVDNDLLKIVKKQIWVDRVIRIFKLPVLGSLGRQDRYERL